MDILEWGGEVYCCNWNLGIRVVKEPPNSLFENLKSKKSLGVGSSLNP